MLMNNKHLGPFTGLLIAAADSMSIFLSVLHRILLSPCPGIFHLPRRHLQLLYYNTWKLKSGILTIFCKLE